MIPLDSRSGLVTDVRASTLRGCLHVAFADLAATTGYGLPLGNPTVSGACWHDPARARLRALGEAAERYCGHLVPADRLVEATWHDLAPDAVDPRVLALYSAGQSARDGFPFTGLGRADRTHWVRGTRHDGTPVWVPAALVWLTPFRASPVERARQSGSVRSRPVLLPVSAGIAAGPDPASARAAALAEVVERHALATAWASERAFPALTGVRSPAVRGVRLSARAVPNLLDAPVVLCVAEDIGDGDAGGGLDAEDGRAPVPGGTAESGHAPVPGTGGTAETGHALASGVRGAVGAGCAFVPGAADPVTAAVWKAAAEAVQSLDTTAQLAVGGLPEWERPGGPLAPHRPGRAFASAYRPDFSDVTDVTCHLQLLADPSFSARILARLARGEPAGFGGFGAAGPFDPDAALAARGLVPVTVDLTTPDIAACGLAVVRVVVPGLRATAPAAFPFLGDGAEPLPARTEPLPVPHA
ncbi:YcaO-like family protein [Planobispora takensis]|uniref:YcaO domain-containing protein n=1 Tax=Planobispora takensis TaxID=1367882 RepID=A0A8J3SV26_9ACTN|nr:YcaO-like family protein [Planobispora takensis]GIH99884.1 hypothetical protein Pta02_18930 [Planobispora takensis]